MTDSGDLLRRYLRGKDELGEPELILSGGERPQTIERLRRFADSAATGRRTGGGAVEGREESGVSRRDSAAGPRSPATGIPAPVELSTDLRRLSREGTPKEIGELPDLASLRAVASACTRCPLHRSRTHVVFADGSAEARVLFVGEAPGQNEDETGIPFVGRAGKLLDRLLVAVGLRREEVFICNVLKCRPPGNRNPLAEEIEQCSPFMLRQVELVDPEVVVALGTFAAQTLLGSRDSLRRMRGRAHLYRGYPLVVTYHPAALLRNPGWTRPAWEDLQLVRAIMAGDDSGQATSAGRVGREAIVSAGDGRVAASDSNLQLSFGDDHG